MLLTILHEIRFRWDPGTAVSALGWGLPSRLSARGGVRGDMDILHHVQNKPIGCRPILSSSLSERVGMCLGVTWFLWRWGETASTVYVHMMRILQCDAHGLTAKGAVILCLNPLPPLQRHHDQLEPYEQYVPITITSYYSFAFVIDFSRPVCIYSTSLFFFFVFSKSQHLRWFRVTVTWFSSSDQSQRYSSYNELWMKKGFHWLAPPTPPSCCPCTSLSYCAFTPPHKDHTAVCACARACPRCL